ncbi:MAG: Maf family protein [Thermodesulfobacteriota bacterium]
MSQIIQTDQPIILASGSPRRQAYFQDLGLNFTVKVADIEEKRLPGESPVAYVERLSREKADWVARANPGSWVVAADTVVCLDGVVLEKPADEEEAVAMLLQLSAQEHVVMTGVCLCNRKQAVSDVRSVSSRVSFWKVPEEMIRAYVKTGEPLDKAGSYGIQGKGGFLVREIVGSYSNIVGLPLCELIEMLANRNLIPLHH